MWSAFVWYDLKGLLLHEQWTCVVWYDLKGSFTTQTVDMCGRPLFCAITQSLGGLEPVCSSGTLSCLFTYFVFSSFLSSGVPNTMKMSRVAAGICVLFITLLAVLWILVEYYDDTNTLHRLMTQWPGIGPERGDVTALLSLIPVSPSSFSSGFFFLPRLIFLILLNLRLFLFLRLLI